MSTATASLDTLCINTIRGLSMDGVQKANSGHPGLPLGAAAMAYALWTRHLRFNPKDPRWMNRDRFILSAGHGSMLLYSLLHLTGYDLPLEQLMQFRQWGSKTPGHPENGLTPGVEMATGPLGQGISTAVGFAIAEKYLAATYNKNGETVIDHFTYGICSDGDLMEGVSGEAASLAGHLQLGKLIFLYDDNGITIDGSTKIAFTEDVAARYEAYGWHTQHVDGLDPDAVDKAIIAAKEVTDKPSLILCKTVIGFGSPNKAGSEKAHGSPLGPQEVILTKEHLGIPTEPLFYIPEDALKTFHAAGERGAEAQAEWNKAFAAYAAKYPQAAEALKGNLGSEWLEALPKFKPEDKLATRKAGQIVLNAIAAKLPNLIGGSADLFESNYTKMDGDGVFQPENPIGRNLCFGIREHAMAAAVNGINLHGGLRAYGSTFLIFSDYCRPSIRLAALMHCPSIFIFTHDSIGVGEDGPTHQPIEQLSSLRAIPNLNVMRPADGNETSACYKIALEQTHTPSLLALSRQNLPTLTPDTVTDHPAEKGAYILQEASSGTPKLVLLATGSEVQHCVGAREVLEAQGIPTRVVSMPSMFLFEKQEPSYRASILPKNVPTVAAEAGASQGWWRYAQATVCIDHFGASAPGDTVMKEFGFTVDNVVIVAKTLL